MRWEAWVVIIDLALSGLIILIRGVVGSVRTYSFGDGFWGAVECVLICWLVLRLAGVA